MTKQGQISISGIFCPLSMILFFFSSAYLLFRPFCSFIHLDFPALKSTISLSTKPSYTRGPYYHTLNWFMGLSRGLKIREYNLQALNCRWNILFAFPTLLSFYASNLTINKDKLQGNIYNLSSTTDFGTALHVLFWTQFASLSIQCITSLYKHLLW